MITAGDIIRLADEYSAACDEVEIIFGEPMREHTSFRLGGGAQIFIRPYTEEALKMGLLLCRDYELPVYILGKGTNLLVSDKGVRGAVFDMTALDGWEIEGTRVRAAAGALLRHVAKAAAEQSLSGLEFAHGIPGSLGGALFMNAGAYGSELKDVTRSLRLMDRGGKIYDVPAEDMDFSYRHSRAEESGEIILSAELVLTPGRREEIEETMRELSEKRRASQPLTTYNAGSTFKRPPGHFAGRLIEEAGLKGFSLGGARVSEKHAGFVVQEGKATAADVFNLCRHVKEVVKEKSGVELSLEVRTWGEF